MSFSENLTRIMEERGVTNYRLAKDLGISQSTVSNWKTERTEPMSVYLEMLSAYFGVPVNELLGEEK